MPTYRITDPDTGKTLRLNGDSPPTEDELVQIFSQFKPKEQPEGTFQDIPFVEEQGVSLGTEISEFTKQAVSGLAGITEAGLSAAGDLFTGGVNEATKTIQETTEKRTRQATTPKAQVVMETLGDVGAWIDDKTFKLGTVAEDIPVVGPAVSTAIKVGADAAIGILTAKLVRKGMDAKEARSIAKAAHKAEREAELIRQAEVDKNFVKRANFRKSQELVTDEPLPVKPSRIKKADKAGIELSEKRFVKRYKKSRKGDGLAAADLETEAKKAWRGYIKRVFKEEDDAWRKQRAAYEAQRREAPVIRGDEAPIDLPRPERMSSLSAKAQSAGDNIAEVLATVVSRLDAIDPTKTLSTSIRKMEHGIERNMVRRNKDLQDFYDLSKEMYNGPLAGNWHKAYLDQDWDRMRALAIQSEAKPKGALPFTRREINYADTFATVKEVLNDMGGEALNSGFKGFKLIENYLPRHMSEATIRRLRNDPELQGLLGKDKMDKVSAVLKRDWDDEVTRLEALNAALVGGGSAKVPAVVAQSAKKRGLMVGEEFYEPLHTALQRYVNDMTESIEIRKFLGKKNVDGSPDLKESLAKMVADNEQMLNLGPRESLILKNVLETRFKEGRMHAPKWIQSLKNFGYITSIGNVWSTITQVGDIVAAMRTLGVKNTIGGLKDITTGKNINIADVGYESIMKELADPSRSATWLDRTLRASGFTSMDRLGKTVVVNASRRKFKKLASTVKGQKKIQEQYGAMFRDAPDEYRKFISDLRKGDIKNENVQFALFNDLADLQPITLSDMPLSYLKGRKYGRLLWALKTWSAQQLNTLYRMTVQEAKRGNRTEAAKNLTKFITYNVIVGTVGVDTFKEWMAKLAAGRDLTAEDVTDNATEGLLRTMFISRYSIAQAKGTTDLWHHITNVFSPSLQGTILRAERALKKEGANEKAKELLKIAPIIGAPFAAYERAKDDKD